MTLAMMNATTDDDECNAVYGPSMALPPLYLVRAIAPCPECENWTHVFMLGCNAFHDAEHLRPIEEFHFLRRARSVPRQVLELLKLACPDFRFDREEGAESEPPYLMNHCPCGARLHDDYTSGDVGAAFWPDTPEGFRRFKLFRLPFEEPIPVESSYMLGGGEYLDYCAAQPWTARQAE